MMNKNRRRAGIVAGIWLGLAISAVPVLAAESPVVNRWIYENEKNQWYYLDKNGVRFQGRVEIAGETYFFDENGIMLTGWVYCPKGNQPEQYSGTMDGNDIFFCHPDGKMAKGWVSAYSPEQAGFDEAEQFESRKEDDYYTRRYYFSDTGKLSCNEKKTIDGKRYIFKEDASCMTGWIYDRGEDAADRFLYVDTDSSDEDKTMCKENPQNLLFGTREDGSLAVDCWVDAIPVWDDADDDVRSFRAAASGYMITFNEGAKNSSHAAVRRKATKIAEIGTYKLEDWSTDVNVIKIDGRYYCLEDSGTRIDGVLYLAGAKGDNAFRDGLYCFTDHAAMRTGQIAEENVVDDISDGYLYYYYFAENTGNRYSKGQAVTGVNAGKLYYFGLAVGAQDETLEVVYLPTLAQKDDSGHGTGLFLVDASGRVKKGSRDGARYTSSNGDEYRVIKEHDRNEEYGYIIDYYDGEKDDDGHKIWKSLTEQDYAYICWDVVEE